MEARMSSNALALVFASFLAVGWAGYGILVEYRTGYLDKLRATKNNDEFFSSMKKQ